MKRIVLFVATNIAVLALLALLVNVLGIDAWLAKRHIPVVGLLVFSAVIGFAGSFISLALSKTIAKWSYNIRVIQQPSSDAEIWLCGKIAEQARKAGVKRPEVGVYESEEVNAFATGPSRNNALVAVSSGLIRRMNLQEIEGVLAHEMSHVTNGDMVTMTLLQGVLNTFVYFLSMIAGNLIDSALRGNNRSESRGFYGPSMGYLIGQMVCQMVLGIFAMMIVMAYSRRREFAADAMATKLASKEAMIAGLQRLKAIMDGNGVIDDRAPALSAFKISGKRSGMMALLASHPPLEDRIAALERLR